MYRPVDVTGHLIVYVSTRESQMKTLKER